jgi:arsenate reductase (thioredoxin)
MSAKVVFACVHNAGRSQMAAAFFNATSDPQKAVAISAGTEPAAKVHPEVLEAMREVGIDLADARPNKLTPELAKGSRFLITMGCGEACPVVPGATREDWPLQDPKGQAAGAVKKIRDEVRERVRAFVAREGWSRS